MKRFVPLLALALAVALPVGAPAAKHAAAGAAGAMSPAVPTCAAGDPVVWVNTETKVYHTHGTTYFGARPSTASTPCTSTATRWAPTPPNAKAAAAGSLVGGTMASRAAAGGKDHRHKGGRR